MLCYRDKTFCSSLGCTNECGRKITPAEIAEAIRVALPVAYADFCSPDPWKDVKKELNNATSERTTD